LKKLLKTNDRNCIPRCSTTAHCKESNGSWHLTLLGASPRLEKLLPFTGADFATMEALCLNTISQIFETHLIRSIDKTTSAELRDNLEGFQSLYAILEY
jgi:hypothetical protein